MEFLLEPPVHERFYDEEKEAMVASTTITSRIYVYLSRFYGTATTSAPAILAVSSTTHTALFSQPRASLAISCVA